MLDEHLGMGTIKEVSSQLVQALGKDKFNKRVGEQQ